jgi:hypothetical protein
MVATARSFAEFGRYLENDEKEVIKKTIQQARALDPEEESISKLNDLLSQLESGAEKLTAAIFTAPASEDLQDSKDRGDDELEESELKELLKSALDDVKS